MKKRKPKSSYYLWFEENFHWYPWEVKSFSIKHNEKGNLIHMIPHSLFLLISGSILRGCLLSSYHLEWHQPQPMDCSQHSWAQPCCWKTCPISQPGRCHLLLLPHWSLGTEWGAGFFCVCWLKLKIKNCSLLLRDGDQWEWTDPWHSPLGQDQGQVRCWSCLFPACLRWRPQLHFMVSPPTPTELRSQPGCQQWDVPGEAGGPQRCVLRSVLIFLINATPTVKFLVFSKFNLAKLPSLEHPFWNLEDWLTLWLAHKYPGLIPEEQEAGCLCLGHSENLGTSALWIPAEIDTLILIPSVDGASLTEEF